MLARPATQTPVLAAAQAVADLDIPHAIWDDDEQRWISDAEVAESTARWRTCRRQVAQAGVLACPDAVLDAGVAAMPPFQVG